MDMSDFSVDYDSINDVDDILDIQKYLMKKHDIKQSAGYWSWWRPILEVKMPDISINIYHWSVRTAADDDLF